METTEKITLTPDTFENVRLMLVSPDRENAVTALMALEQMEFKNCKMYMVLLYKESADKREMWKENAPNLTKNIEALGIDAGFSLKSIYNILKEQVSSEELDVYFDRFGKGLSVLLKDWGYKGMIDELEITIKRKA